MTVHCPDLTVRHRQTPLRMLLQYKLTDYLLPMKELPPVDPVLFIMPIGRSFEVIAAPSAHTGRATFISSGAPSDRQTLLSYFGTYSLNFLDI